jgi:signal transduction histidine kinase
MWPRPGQNVSTQKSTYVSKANFGGKWLLVGCGVYLPGALRKAPASRPMAASELVQLVRAAAAVFEKQGEKAFPEFRKKGSRWFHDDTYFFVWDLNGKRVLHAADPSLEGQNGADARGAHDRPYGKMFLQVGQSLTGEGWVHYMYPEPSKLFPVWKSAFIKRVTFPSGQKFLIGSGVYNMKLDKTLLVDLVDRAAKLVSRQGRGAFSQLRDKEGPFLFMDTYVFVDTPDGTEVVNPGQPTLEGKNLIHLKDASGKAVAREYIDLALKKGEGWVNYEWYKPGENATSKKESFVRKVQSGNETFIVGAGIYEN